MHRLAYITCFISTICFAQQASYDLDKILQERIDYASNVAMESENIDALNELYAFYIKSPLAITKENIEKIESLKLLSTLQLNALRKHVLTYGNLISIYELQVLPHWSKDDILRIQPFITTKKEPKKWRLKHQSSSFLYRVQTTNQEQLIPKWDSTHLGAPFKQYLRFRSNLSSINIGFNAENDYGEPFFQSPNKYGFDYYSGFISLQTSGFLKQMVVGDFQANFGQGLVLNTGFGFGKSFNLQSISKVDNGIRPYASGTEYHFLRGIASELKIKSINIIPFILYRKANAKIDSINHQGIVFSIPESTGYHRDSEMFAHKKSTTLQGAGLHIKWDVKNTVIGLSGFRYKYNGEFTQSPLPYANMMESPNHRDSKIGFNFHHFTNKGIFFGEIAYSKHKNKAILLGTTLSLNPKYNTSIVYRNYDQKFNSLYANAFADGESQNESGLFWGSHIIFNDKLDLHYLIDLFSSKWVENRLAYRPKTTDHQVKLNYQISKKKSTYLLYRHELSPSSITAENAIMPKFAYKQKHVVRLHNHTVIGKLIKLQNRVETNSIKLHNKSTYGWLMYQQVQISWNKTNLFFRYTQFHANDFDNRIYSYENDVLFSFHIPAYHKTGNSYFVMLNRSFGNGFKVWFRIANNRTKADLETKLNYHTFSTNISCTIQVQWKF